VDMRVVLDELLEICENGTEWNQVEQMRLMRTKSGRPIGRYEINSSNGRKMYYYIKENLLIKYYYIKENLLIKC